jgi:hypothetical protein
MPLRQQEQTTTLDTIARYLNKVSWSGSDRLQASCPAHEDKNPSFSASDSDGKLLFKCHAGCSQAEVVESLIRLGAWHTSDKRYSPPLKSMPKAKHESNPPQSSTATYAIELWLAANKWMRDGNWLDHPSPDVSVMAHPYAVAKGIESAGGVGRGKASGKLIGKQSDCLIVPIRNIQSNKVQGVQCISTDGVKQSFGSVSGGALILGNTLDKSLIWYVCEGWASAYSTVFHHQNGKGVCACSFGKSNLDKTAKIIAKNHKPEEIIILREDDS